MTNNLSYNKIDTEVSGNSGSELLYEKEVNHLEDGTLVKGKVLCIMKDAVIVDIGYKSEGHIPVKEFLDTKGNLQIKVGDEIEALLETSDDEKGHVVLSVEKARKMKMRGIVEDAFNTGKTVEGRIVQRVKGGFSVDLNGIAAFLPGSQVDTRPLSDSDKLIGSSSLFKILQYDGKKMNIVVSRRAVLEEELERTKKDTMQILEEGKIVDGMVKNITNYGVFIDLGGVDGLLHVSDISWGRVKNPADVFKLGDKVSVKILKLNKGENKISLGLKQIKPNPWDAAGERYSIGSQVNGRVVSIMDYGAFVELEEGLEGLVHISELGWKKIKHPSQRLKVGDTVEAKILEIDSANKKIALSIKQIETNPWDEIALKYPKGTRVKGTVKNVADFGLFIGIEDGVDGLAHISDISWKKIRHPSELFQKGQEIEAEVLNIDRERERLALSIKALQKDPWKGIDEKYHPGMSLNGRITNITNFGAFVEIEDGVEGLIHVSELQRKGKKGDAVKVGDMVEVEILNIYPEEKKIGLGLNQLVGDQDKSTTAA